MSVNSINKFLQFTREFHKYVAEIENIEYKKLELLHDPKFYIDLNKLMSVTITHNHYKTLIRLLTIDSGDISYNNRDAAILVLAWNSCDNADVKNLMKDDLKFYTLGGKEICKIRLKNRYVVIDDEEEIEIIKRTFKTHHKYFYEGRKMRTVFFNLRILE